MANRFMALPDDIIQLRDDHIAALDASHNYYTHTRDVWRLFQQLVEEGHSVTFENQVTGSKASETDVSGLAHGYVTGYLISATFQHFVALFEQFMFDFLRAWLTEYPGNLSGNQLQFRTVVEAVDKREIVAAVVQKEVIGLAYKRIDDWFANLEKVANLGCPTPDQIAQLAEIKASRDVLVHNNGFANSTYIAKSKGLARFADGELLEVPEHYHRESWLLIKQVVSDIADAGINKLGA